MRLKELINKGDFVKVYKGNKVVYTGYTNFMDDKVLNNETFIELDRYDIYKHIYII